MPGAGRLGDLSQVPSDAHGCPACPHPAVGPAISGSNDIKVNGLPALRVDDSGIHTACCGLNTWVAKVGSDSVFINGRPAHRLGDDDEHCGGDGNLVSASNNVIFGGGKTSVTRPAPFCLQCMLAAAMSGTPFVQFSAGSGMEGF